MSRPTILTEAALAQVKTLVKQGMSAAEIAREIGCTLGTLRVRCCQFGISLRRVGVNRREQPCDATELVVHGKVGSTRHVVQRQSAPSESARWTEAPSPSEPLVELKLRIPSLTEAQLRQRAALRGVSGATLAAELLVTIASDGLYDAVLDGR
jgi:Helix-turn-helix domain of resolvase